MSELDLELLLSLVKGLGSFVADERGDKVYSKDADCLGEPSQPVQPADLLRTHCIKYCVLQLA